MRIERFTVEEIKGEKLYEQERKWQQNHFLKANFKGPGSISIFIFGLVYIQFARSLDFIIWDFCVYMHVHAHTHAHTLIFFHFRDPG